MKPIIALVGALLLFVSGAYTQQNRIVWPEGQHFNCGVIVPVEEDPETWMVRDTVPFVNAGHEPLVINKLHVYRPERFSCTQRVMPGDTGYIYLADKTNPYGSYIVREEIRLNVQSTFAMWDMVTFDYCLAQFLTEKYYRQDGSLEKVVGPWPDDKPFARVLTTYPNGMPQSFGLFHTEKQVPLDPWNQWSANGKTLPDKTENKHVQIIAYTTNGTLEQNLQVVGWRNGAQYIPVTYSEYANTQAWLLPQTDSIRIFNDTLRKVIPVKFDQLRVGTSYHTYVAKPNALWVNDVPIRLRPNQYFISWAWPQQGEPRWPKIPERAAELNALFFDKDNQRIFDSGPAQGEMTMLDLTGLSDKEQANIIQKLLEHRYVWTLSQALDLPHVNYPTYVFREIYMDVDYSSGVTLDSLKAVLNHYDFEYKGAQPGGGHRVQYKYPLLDETFIRNTNAVKRHPGFKYFEAQAMEIMELEELDPHVPTPIEVPD